MKFFVILTLIAGVIYSLVIKAAMFMFASFILVLATVGLYDLLIHPFVKNRRGERRAA